MIKVFLGYDAREAVGTWVFQSSALRRSSLPISFTALAPNTLARIYEEEHGDNSNAFTYSRFLVPALCDFQGFAIFVDGADMLCRADMAELWALRDPFKALQVVQHDYQSRAARKYIGTAMEADNRSYPRKNWSSVMIMNCAHYDWRKITPSSLPLLSGEFLHQFQFIRDKFIGEIPREWNHLVGEYPQNSDAKIAHYTLGVPAMDHYKDSEFADEWRDELKFTGAL